VLDGLFMLPLGVSAVTLGFGFLITLDKPPLDLRSSPVLVPIAQAMVALPLVVRVLAPVLRSVDPRQRQAAASLGASPLRVALTVDLPHAWRALLAATGFAFAVSLGEFGATSFLARPERPTLPVVIYQLMSRPGESSFGMAVAASVVLGLLTAAVMTLVERLRLGSAGAW
jgi:thiamine transport system permease protein